MIWIVPVSHMLTYSIPEKLVLVLVITFRYVSYMNYCSSLVQFNFLILLGLL